MEQIRRVLQNILAERGLLQTQLEQKRLNLEYALSKEEYDRRWSERIDLHTLIVQGMRMEEKLREELRLKQLQEQIKKTRR